MDISNLPQIHAVFELKGTGQKDEGIPFNHFLATSVKDFLFANIAE
jgi:hypothetical protein